MDNAAVVAGTRSQADANDAPPDFAVVGVGASAGGLDAFRKLLEPMPADCGMAFVLVQHLDPTHTSHTAELLRSHTQLSVVEVSDGLPVEANRVYVIPPGAYLSISGNELRLSEPIERRGVRVPIDFFFRSLAEDQQQRAICVILSGTGSDGTLGLREVKAAGGIVLAQDPSTSQFDGMPRSAIVTGLVDYVLPPDQMADVLTRYIRHWYVNGEAPPPADQERDDFNAVLAILRTRNKYDFSCYKKGTLSRRVQRRMGLRHVETLAEYASLLRAEPDEATALFKDMLIGVTNFFREPEAWPVLRDEVIRPLVAGVGMAGTEPRSGIRKHADTLPAGILASPATDGPLRVWVPGCATGEEAYSIAMLVIEELQAAGKNQDLQVFASDIDHDALSFGRAGIYPENVAADVSPERLRQFFIKGEHTYRINKELREAVVFAEQNLIGDPPFAKLDLISCRNLLIYLEPDVQQRIIAMFHFALREGGCLFLGNSETIGGQHDLFQPLSKKWRIYRRVGPLRPAKVMFPIVTGQHAPALPQRSAAPVAALLGVSRLTQQLLLERYSPACVLVNRTLEVLYLHGPTDGYLQLPAGEPSTDLLAMAREGLRTRLRAVVRQAVDQGETAATIARVRRDGKYHHVRITAEPLRHPHEAEGLVLVTFDTDGGQILNLPATNIKQVSNLPKPPSAEKTGGLETCPTSEADQLVAQLEDELRSSREEMQGLIEELETSNEEMKAANEEATSINEELQSTNEELETSKEELQSLNEELTTVNSQLEAKMGELEATNNDLHNLLTSTEIATVFLDRQFRIKRFTPAATGLMRLIPSDIGRPLSDIVLNFDDPDLPADVEAVLARLTQMEKEIQTGDGAWYTRRVLPYRTEDNRIDGVVITLTDITDRKRAEEVTQQLNVALRQQVDGAHRAAHRIGPESASRGQEP